jgi:cytidine deaminase
MSKDHDQNSVFTELGHTESLDNSTRILIDEAIKASKNAYAPYSGFHVGCVLLLTDGSMVHGANQENAAYPSGLCAERVALFSLGATQPNKVVKKMLVLAYRTSVDKLLPATSCGACRQVMLEFENKQNSPIEIYMMHETNQWIVAPSASSLLPLSFNADSLKK